MCSLLLSKKLTKMSTCLKKAGRRPPIKYIRKNNIKKRGNEKMIEHLRKIQCQCGNTFEIFGKEEYKCSCEKTWITRNDYSLSYRVNDDYGHNFEILIDNKYISDDSGLINADVVALYEICKEKAKLIGFSWYESTTKTRNSNKDIITYINATYGIPLNNEIERNRIEFCLTLEKNNHGDYLKRFANFLIVLEELEKGELDFSDRAGKHNDYENAFHKLIEKHEDFDFEASERSLDYKDVTFTL